MPPHYDTLLFQHLHHVLCRSSANTILNLLFQTRGLVHQLILALTIRFLVLRGTYLLATLALLVHLRTVLYLLENAPALQVRIVYRIICQIYYLFLLLLTLGLSR